MTDRTCSEPGCERKHSAESLCAMHWQRLRRTGTTALASALTPLERFTAKYRVADNGCWIWTARVNVYGYGQFYVDDRQHRAHRISYELFVGPIPDGLVIDHLCHGDDPTCPAGVQCRHRACVNPAHLEPVAQRENLLRGRTAISANVAKTHCINNHPFDEVNTYLVEGARACRTCHRDTECRRKARKKEAAHAGV